nr:immunoglobulin heavy chain junction region [Mus musculus]
CESYYGRGNYW